MLRGERGGGGQGERGGRAREGDKQLIASHFSASLGLVGDGDFMEETPATLG